MHDFVIARSQEKNSWLNKNITKLSHRNIAVNHFG